MKNKTHLTNVIFDIDGTISKNGNPISKDIILSIQALSKKNINVTFATARSLRDTLPLLLQDFHLFPIIGCNGGTYSENAKVQQAKTLSVGLVDTIKNVLDKLNVPYIIDGLYNYSVSPITCEFHYYITHNLGSKPKTYEEIKIEGITKILLLYWDKTTEDILKNLIATHQFDVTLHVHRQENFVDIAPAKTDKFYTSTERGIDFSSTAVFGNDRNDLLLLQNAYLPYVVGDNLISHIDFAHTHIKNVSDVPMEIAKLINGL